MSKDRGSVANPGVALRDLIRKESDKRASTYDQIALATVSDVGDGVTVGVLLDGFTGGEILATWAVPGVVATVDQRVTMMTLAGGQQWFVTGVAGYTPAMAVTSPDDQTASTFSWIQADTGANWRWRHGVSDFILEHSGDAVGPWDLWLRMDLSEDEIVLNKELQAPAWNVPQNGGTGQGDLRLAPSGSDNQWSFYWDGGAGSGTGELQLFGNAGDTLNVTLLDGKLTIDAGGIEVTGTTKFHNTVQLNPDGGGLIRLFEAGPMGIQVYETTGVTMESALYWRSSPNTWSFEDGAAQKILEIDPDVQGATASAVINTYFPIDVLNSFGQKGGSIYNVDTSGRSVLVAQAATGTSAGPLLALYADDDTSYAGDVRLDAKGGLNLFNWDDSVARFLFTQTIWAQLSGLNVATTNASMFIGAHNGTTWGSKLQIQGQAGSNAYLRWFDEEVEKFRADYGGNIHITGTQWIAGGISNNTYLQQVEGSYLRWVENGTERWRVSNAGYVYANGKRYYFGVGQDDYISFDDASNRYTFIIDNASYFLIDSDTGVHISGADPYTTRYAWLTVAPASTGGNFDDQEGGISIGESGLRGSAAMHLVYTGDGYGHIGMGVVTIGNATPMTYRAFRLKYNSSELYVQGGTLYMPNMGTTGTFTQTLRQDTTSPYRVLRYSSTKRMKTDIVDLGEEHTALGVPVVEKERAARRRAFEQDMRKYERNLRGKKKDNPKPVDDVALEESIAIKHNKWLRADQVVAPWGVMAVRPVSYLPSEDDAAGPHHRNRRNVGFLAEEFALVYPSLVGYDDDGEPEGINYESFVAVLTKFVQQLRLELTEAQDRIAILEAA